MMRLTIRNILTPFEDGHWYRNGQKSDMDIINSMIAYMAEEEAMRPGSGSVDPLIKRPLLGSGLMA